MKIDQEIKKIRKTNGLSQEEFAKMLAVSRQAVSKWERGSSLPDIENLMYISNLFNVSLDTLIKNDSGLKQKLIKDNSAKKWHKLNIVFFASLIIYLAYFGLANDIWLVGLSVASAFMMAIDIRILVRKK